MPDDLENLRRKRAENIRSWVRSKVVNQARQPAKKPVSKTIVIAERPEEVEGKPCIRVPATCPLCRRQIDILFPKSVVKEFQKMFKVNASSSTRLSSIAGFPRVTANLPQTFKPKKQRVY